MDIKKKIKHLVYQFNYCLSDNEKMALVLIVVGLLAIVTWYFADAIDSFQVDLEPVINMRDTLCFLTN